MVQLNILATFLVIGSFIGIGRADDLSQGGQGTNLESSLGYNLNSQIDHGGKPAGSLYGYIGGKMSQIPGQPGANYYEIAPQPPTAVWQSQLTSAAYFVSGAAAAISIWYLCHIALGNKSVSDLEDSSAKKEATKTTGKETEEDKTVIKSRRRRETREADENMARLASIVLTAVESGECLQKSICLLGNQMYEMSGQGNKKASKKTIMIADSLLSTLLPPSIQQSSFYNVLRKSVRGEITCEQFKCMNH